MVQPPYPAPISPASVQIPDDSPRPVSRPRTSAQPKARPRPMASQGREGKPFTKKGKQQVIDENKKANGGRTKCTNCGVGTIPSKKSQKGVRPSPRETQVDHIVPKSKGGRGAPDNGQVLCRKCNRTKSDGTPEE